MTQKEIVLKELRETGFVSRNWCLSNHISRLGAIMNRLKNEGIKFRTVSERTKDRVGDYKYILEK